MSVVDSCHPMITFTALLFALLTLPTLLPAQVCFFVIDRFLYASASAKGRERAYSIACDPATHANVLSRQRTLAPTPAPAKNEVAQRYYIISQWQQHLR
jgi:hypothetical protein